MKLNKKQIAITLVVIAIGAWVYYSLTTPSNLPSTIGTTSNTIPAFSSTTNAFSVNSFDVTCHSDGGLDVSFDIVNANGVSFNLVGAKVVLLNYTLNNGTTLFGQNQQFSANEPTYATMHKISGHFRLAVYPSNLMTHAWVMITLDVGEPTPPNPIFFRILGCSNLS